MKLKKDSAIYVFYSDNGRNYISQEFVIEVLDKGLVKIGEWRI